MTQSQLYPNGILFLKSPQPQTIEDLLLKQNLSREQIENFLNFGSIYVDGKRVLSNLELLSDQVVRVHTRPKKYQWELGALNHRIVFQDEDLLVLDKPAGLPVHATLDNRLENAKYILEQELGLPLFTTHRLDIPTEGLLILAKNPRAQTEINHLFARRQVQKIYHAITEKPVALGLHTLYLDPKTHVPRKHSWCPTPGWWFCQLEVLGYKPLDSNFCLKINLLTGKTHQIRAQLSALGMPIVGDTLYGSRRKYVHERLALECYSLSFTYRSRTLAFIRPNSISLDVPHT